MGRLTTHILDTSQGKPGAGISLALYAIETDKERRHVKTVVTNNDGRTDAPLLDDTDFQLGNWELVFNVGDYFAQSVVPVADPPFLDQISIRFAISADEHYHVPLLASPWSYSTYRGS